VARWVRGSEGWWRDSVEWVCVGRNGNKAGEIKADTVGPLHPHPQIYLAYPGTIHLFPELLIAPIAMDPQRLDTHERCT
jgi:hypothetical protein